MNTYCVCQAQTDVITILNVKAFVLILTVKLENPLKFSIMGF